MWIPSFGRENDIYVDRGVISNNLPLHRLAIKNAFLNGILDEEIYIEQPLGFVVQRECAKKVCRLKKTFYDLKQAPRAWFGYFASMIQEFGLCRAEKDLYVLTDTIWEEDPASCVCE